MDGSCQVAHCINQKATADTRRYSPAVAQAKIKQPQFNPQKSNTFIVAPISEKKNGEREQPGPFFRHYKIGPQSLQGDGAPLRSPDLNLVDILSLKRGALIPRQTPIIGQAL